MSSGVDHNKVPLMGAWSDALHGREDEQGRWLHLAYLEATGLEKGLRWP